MTSPIVVLNGADRVRKRPAVIFGSEDAQGALTMVEMMIDLLAEDVVKRKGDQVSLIQYQDGSFELYDIGGGYFLDGPKDETDKAWVDLFCQMYAAPRYELSNAQGETGNRDVTDNLELCASQYASEYMEVCVNREGVTYRLCFKNGEKDGDLTKIVSDEPPGTVIRFKPDPAVFSDIHPDGEAVCRKLQTLALGFPGLKTIYRKKLPEGFERRIFCYPEGAKSYLQQKNEEAEIYTAALSAVGQDRYNRPPYEAKATVALCFAKDAGFVECYHNRRNLSFGGTHLDALIERITQYVDWMLDGEIGEDAVRKHLQLVVVTESKHTAWVNGTRTAINNVFLRDLTQDTAGEDFRYYIKQNRQTLQPLFE